jgi:protein-L-isoaspartate(D-aspartate) O-methyltransferase
MKHMRSIFVVGAFPLVVMLTCGVAQERPSEPDWKALRERMVKHQIEARGVKDPRVLDAMRSVERHLFVPESYRRQAYEDHPLPIGLGQTISQPFIVAIMTALLEPEPDDTMLEIGTGSGYQAAVLSKLVKHVYTIEIVHALAARSKEILKEQGYDNITVIQGDGYRGLPEKAPFDGIIVTAAPGEVPQPLIDQLAVGARLVIPVGTWYQELKVLTRTPEGIETQSIIPVRFVPMTGEAEKKK